MSSRDMADLNVRKKAVYKGIDRGTWVACQIETGLIRLGYFLLVFSVLVFHRVRKT